MIITLCGSNRFQPLFHSWSRRLALHGHTPIGLAFYHTDGEEEPTLSHVQKAVLDGCHLRKISASNAILVLNEGGYVGSSTVSEMVYASDTGKPIFLLEPHLAATGLGIAHLKDPKAAPFCGEHVYTFNNGSEVDAILEALGRGGIPLGPRSAN